VAVLALGTSGDVVRVWGDGQAEFTALYALRRVSAGDTVDLTPDFDPPLRGALVGVTVAGVVQATLSGNVLTIPGGVTNDAAYLLVFGVHA
jgi:hypothetical protein